MGLGMLLEEVFAYLSEHTFEVVLITIAVFIIFALIYFLVTKDIRTCIPIVLNGPPLALIPAFVIAEIARDCMDDGIVWGILTGFIYIFLGVVGWLLAIGIAALCLFFVSIIEDDYRRKYFRDAADFMKSFMISGAGAALQIVILYFANNI